MSDKAVPMKLGDNTDNQTVSLDHDGTEQISAAPTATIHSRTKIITNLITYSLYTCSYMSQLQLSTSSEALTCIGYEWARQVGLTLEIKPVKQTGLKTQRRR